MCLIQMSTLEDLNETLLYLTETWPKRCNRVLYFLISSDKTKEDIDMELDAYKLYIEIYPFKNQLEIFKHLQQSDDFQAVDWFLVTPMER